AIALRELEQGEVDLVEHSRGQALRAADCILRTRARRCELVAVQAPDAHREQTREEPECDNAARAQQAYATCGQCHGKCLRAPAGRPAPRMKLLTPNPWRRAQPCCRCLALDARTGRTLMTSALLLNRGGAVFFLR